MVQEIKITEILDATTNKFIVAYHENLNIAKNLHMTQKVRCVFFENDNDTIGAKTTDVIAAEQIPTVEKKRRLEQFKDFVFQRDTINTFIDTATGEHVPPDPNTGEAPTGAGVIPELAYFQLIPNFAGETTIAGNVYALIEAQIQKIVDKNIRGL